MPARDRELQREIHDGPLVQDVLAEPAWADPLTPEDRRGLTPLFWAHVARTAR